MIVQKQMEKTENTTKQCVHIQSYMFLKFERHHGQKGAY